MKWKVIVVLLLLLHTTIFTNAQQKLITIKDISKQQKEYRLHKNGLLPEQFNELKKNSSILKAGTLSKMPWHRPLIASLNLMPVLRYIHPKYNKIPNGYQILSKQK